MLESYTLQAFSSFSLFFSHARGQVRNEVLLENGVINVSGQVTRLAQYRI